jgi:hypothetical protein
MKMAIKKLNKLISGGRTEKRCPSFYAARFHDEKACGRAIEMLKKLIGGSRRRKGLGWVS